MIIDLRGRMDDGGIGWGPMIPHPGLVWHHTAAFFMAANPTAEDEINHILMIERYHISRGYTLFGYHGIAFPSGGAYWTGDLDRRRAHVQDRNHEFVGFALVGDYSDSIPLPDTLRAAAQLRAHYVTRYGVQVDEHGHADVALPTSPTSCPGRLRSLWIPKIGQEANDLLPDERKELLRIGAAVDAIAAQARADTAVYVKIKGNEYPAIYRLDEDEQTLTHVPNFPTYEAQTPAVLTEYPATHLIWNLATTYPAGVPKGVLRP
jgi:hypothetical protein